VEMHAGAQLRGRARRPTDMPSFRAAGLAVAVAGLVPWLALVLRAQAQAQPPDIKLFFMAAAQDERQAQQALEQLAAAWRDGYAAILWDIARFMRPPADTRIQRPTSAVADADDPFRGGVVPPTVEPEHPTTAVRRRLVRFLERQTGQRLGQDLERWHQWIWKLPYEPHPEYALFKGIWYGEIDPRFREFFPPGAPSRIRLDEIDWGGVPVNGIPPLEYPRHIAAEDADYLDADHLVFGLAINGEARAYPKRILAWHEMALDRVGGVELTVVYCTLCGTLIPYESVADDLGMEAGAARVAVHRLRRRFRSLLREAIGATVSDAGEIDDEIRHLIAAVSR